MLPNINEFSMVAQGNRYIQDLLKVHTAIHRDSVNDVDELLVCAHHEKMLDQSLLKEVKLTEDDFKLALKLILEITDYIEIRKEKIQDDLCIIKRNQSAQCAYEQNERARK